MEIAVGVETQLGRAMVAVGQLLARVTERLEMANGVGMLEGGHAVSLGPELHSALWSHPGVCLASVPKGLPVAMGMDEENEPSQGRFKRHSLIRDRTMRCR